MSFRFTKRYDFWTTNWKEVGGVYGLLDSGGGVIYVGQTNDLKRRMSEHQSDDDHCIHPRGVKSVIVEVIASERERLAREQELIHEYDPPCNQA